MNNKEFEIWSEGYNATGESGGPSFIGKSWGVSFSDACDNYARRNPEFHSNYDPENLTHWACCLHPSKESAIKRLRVSKRRKTY